MADAKRASATSDHHVPWAFRREAFVWDGDRPSGLNFHPYGTECHNWLTRTGSFALFAREDQLVPNALTNSYTYATATIAAIMAQAINDSHTFATGTEAIAPIDAEIRRIRLTGEQMLYAARLCEALIKQLLHCTQIPDTLYRKASLGGLLSQSCKECRKPQGANHRISLLGSLAHHFRLCNEFDGCTIEHMRLVAERRNIEAAHAAAATLDVRTARESRAQLESESVTLGTALVHMLGHVRELERRFEEELQLIALGEIARQE